MSKGKTAASDDKAAQRARIEREVQRVLEAEARRILEERAAADSSSTEGKS